MSRLLRITALLIIPATASAQEAPPTLTQAEEISLARSAAPPEISDRASVLALADGRYRRVAEGSSGVTCMVSRSQPLSLEPICYDEEASRTILPLEIARVHMRLDGVSTEEIDHRLDAAIERGEMDVPSRPAMAFMMSPRQVLYADPDTRVGAWQPHVHIHIPYATSEQFGGLTSATTPFVGHVVDEGKATANLVIVVPDFVAPAVSGSR